MERRKYDRYRAKDGGLVFIRSEPAVIGKIVDISMGGIAFYYDGNVNQIIDEYEIFILFADDSFFMDIDRFRTVVDFEIVDDTEANYCPLRKRGVEFGKLNISQKDHLEYFLRFHTTTDNVGEF